MMTARERILATLQGKPVDRVAIYTQIPFAVGPDGFRPGPFYGYPDHDDWREQDPAYWRLVQRMERECDNFFVWRPPCMEADQIFIPVSQVEHAPEYERDGMVIKTHSLQIDGHKLQTVHGCQPRAGHTWLLEHYCKEPEDAKRLLEIPWDGHPAELGDFFEIESHLGDKGVIWVTVPSPILVVCRLFDPTDFLMLPLTEPALLHRLLEVAAIRIRANLEALLEAGVGPVVRFGGAERATPPMMSPQLFDELVVRYDAPLIDLVKKHGHFVAVHCHGRIRHALQRFREMGVDQTDPVEQPPDGDVSLAEAREISRHAVTLSGNLQIRELASLSPDEVRQRVHAIIDEAGTNRLVVTTTGTPLEAIPPAIEANYNALIDAVLSHQCP